MLKLEVIRLVAYHSIKREEVSFDKLSSSVDFVGNKVDGLIGTKKAIVQALDLSWHL